MNRILLVTIRWIVTPLNPEMMDAVLATKGDWVRWNGWTWLLSTTASLEEVRAAVMSRLTDQDSLIIAEVGGASSFEGWAPQWVWNWISDHANPNFRPTALPPPPPPSPTPNPFFAALMKKNQ